MKVRTREEAHIRGEIEAAPIVRLVQAWVDLEILKSGRVEANDNTSESPLILLSVRSGVHEDTIRKYLKYPRTFVDFDTADRIITAIDPWLFRADEELAECYQAFNFTHLDLAHPTAPDADSLLARYMKGETLLELARSVGIADTRVMQRAIWKRQAMAAA